MFASHMSFSISHLNTSVSFQLSEAIKHLLMTSRTFTQNSVLHSYELKI